MESFTKTEMAVALARLQEEIEKCQVRHPRVQTALDFMREAQENAVQRSGRRAVLFFGASRCGKTKLFKIYRDEANKGTEPGREKVLFLSLTGAATVDSVVSDLLEAVGDPMATVGTISAKTSRLESILIRRGIEMIQIDEGQHMVENRSTVVLGAIANWFKSLMNDRVDAKPKRLSFAIGGTATILPLLIDEQLRNRFFTPIELQLFGGSSEVEVRDMRVLLRALTDQITVAKAAGLSSTEMATRFRMATAGRIGVIVELIEEAGKIAIHAGRACLAVGDLADAYDKLIGDCDDSANPFRADLISLVNGVLEDQRRKRSLGRKMNRRIRRKKKNTKLRDVLNNVA